jgi:hypothetical protein
VKIEDILTYRQQDLKVNDFGKQEVVAEWSDGIPQIVIRYDTPGLITYLPFWIGEYYGCLDFVINAISLDR